jgi:flagellar motor switch protein FliM
MAPAISDSTAPWRRDPKGETSGPSIEKAPQLTSSLSRFADGAAQALAALFGGAFAGALEAMESPSTFDLLAERDGQCAALLHSSALDARLGLIMDARVVDVIVATMFGVDPAVDALVVAAARPRTELESRLLGEISKSLAEALRMAFAPVATFDVDFESLNTIEDVHLFGAKDMPAISARYTIKAPGGSFWLIVALPQPLTAPLGHLFTRGPTDGASKLDPKWAERMETGVKRAHMTLTAILDEFELTLGEIAQFSVGGVLTLTGEGEGRVRMECAERGVFICKLGERAQRYALEVEDIIARPIEPPYPESIL